MSVLVTGSLAIDHIMVFPDRFRNHILPDRLHVLNVAFHVPTLRRHFGGTAGNIAYYLRLLGEQPILLAAAGDDFGPYAVWLDERGIRRDGIRVFEDHHTAQAFITTDLDDNQITAFHPGAMERAHEVTIADVRDSFRIAIVAPNGKAAMQAYARELKARGVPVVIDPGQQLPVFDAQELLELMDGAKFYIVNDYEWSVTLERTGLKEEDVAERVETVVVTRGAEGSTLLDCERQVEIPAVRAGEIVDPTGCGDAYRAGLLYGWLRDLPLEKAARLGSLMGSLVVQVHGTQSLDTDFEAIHGRFQREFGSAL